MKNYKFYDTDIWGNEEYDICGLDYYVLLETCFMYCSTVSFLVDNREDDQVTALHTIEQYRIPVTQRIIDVYCHYSASLTQDISNGHYEIRHYKLDDSVREYLCKTTDGLFCWLHGWGYNNPSDPVFFRSDGSTFLYSVIHEGECTLLPRDGEDVSAILANGMWHITDERVSDSK